MDALEKSGAAKADIEIVEVPGAFELPLASKKLAGQGEYDALIAIGCVIRGETSHFDYVCSETARGLQLAQMDTGVPIIFCVLTCETPEQAIARAGGDHGNKGYDSGIGGHRDGATLTEAERKSPANGVSREKASARLVSLRTKSREFAMQMLFQWDMSRQDPAKLEAKFWRTAKAADSTRGFANRLFEGAAKDADELDALIVQHAQNWRLERMAIIDRAVLRLAIYELRIAETPPKVVLNEAVDLAKKFSSEDAGAFVNGILDAVNKSLVEKAAGTK